MHEITIPESSHHAHLFSLYPYTNLVRFYSFLKILSQSISQQIHQQDNHNQDQCRAISQRQLCLHIRSTGGNHIQMIRQGHTLIQNTGRKLRQEVCGTSKQNRRRLSRNTSQGENQPVIMFGIPIGRMTCQIVCNFVAPNARLPSRILSGMAFKASSVVRMTKGTQSKPNVKEPARILSPNPYN